MTRRILSVAVTIAIEIILLSAVSAFGAEYDVTVVNPCNVSLKEVEIQFLDAEVSDASLSGWAAVSAGGTVKYGTNLPNGTYYGSIRTDAATSRWQWRVWITGESSPREWHGPFGPIYSSALAGTGISITSECPGGGGGGGGGGGSQAAPVMNTFGIVLLAVGLLLVGGLIIRSRRAPKSS